MGRPWPWVELGWFLVTLWLGAGAEFTHRVMVESFIRRDITILVMDTGLRGDNMFIKRSVYERQQGRD